MKITKKKAENGKVLVEAVATAQETAEAFDVAQSAFAQQMGLRFEEGKTIAQVAEERMGVKDLDAMVVSNAIEYLMPFAIDKSGVVPSFPPEVQPMSSIKRGEQFSFALTITPKPHYELSSYEPVEISIRKLEVSEEAIDEQIAQMADRFAEYVADEPHAMSMGDRRFVETKALKGDEEIPSMTFDGRSHTLGGGLFPEEFDKGIVGMEVGETREFSFDMPAFDEEGNQIVEKVDCTVTVKEAQKKVPPTIDDAWVARHMPMYESVAAMRQGIADSLLSQQSGQYEGEKYQAGIAELVKRLADCRIPDEVYEAMYQNLVNSLRAQLRREGLSFDEFVEQQGGKQQFNMFMMLQVRQTLLQGYALDALYRHEKLSLADADYIEACQAMSPQDPAMVRMQMERTGLGFTLREMAERIKAGKWMLAHAKVNDAEFVKGE